MSENIIPSLAVISSRYQTTVTEVVFTLAVTEVILEPNARRWYVRFDVGQGVGQPYVLPLPITIDISVLGNSNLPQEFKFRDCPSIVQGGFAGAGQAGTSIIITEVEYLD